MKLLLIDVRGLQAEAIGPYGNRWIETSTLNALAAQGVVFDRHLSIHPLPGCAHAVWRSGRYQFSSQNVSSDLLALVRSRGVRTHLLIDSSRPWPAEFAAGWDQVRECTDTPAVLESARELLAQLESESWMVWLELAALLPPWQVSPEIVDAYFANLPTDEEEEEDAIDEEPDEEMLEDEEQHEPLMDPPTGVVDATDDDLYLRVQKSYAAAISQVDILLGNLLDGMPDDVLVVLTANAGQSLGEHGVIGGESSLHTEVVHVPLIFAGAGCRSGRHVGALTASVDLAPTIADLFGATMPEAHGHSLVRLLAEEEQVTRPYIVIGAGESLAIWTPERTLIVPGEGEPRLYVKPDDRCEVNDVHQHETDRAESMARTLRAFVEASARPGPIEAELATDEHR